MNPRLVLFDVDGTLIDTAGAGRRAMERACFAVFGIDGVRAKSAGVEFAGRTDPVILENVSLAVGVTPERYASARDELRSRFVAELQAEMRRPEPRRRVLPGVSALLDALRTRAGVHLGLVTGNLEAGARAKLDPFGLNGYFPSGGFASDHADRREIARIGWRRMSEHAGIEFDPTHVAVVGDTEHDVDCARANGFRAVAVSTGWVPQENLERAAPDYLLDALSDSPHVLDALGLV